MAAEADDRRDIDKLRDNAWEKRWKKLLETPEDIIPFLKREGLAPSTGIKWADLIRFGFEPFHPSQNTPANRTIMIDALNDIQDRIVNGGEPIPAGSIPYVQYAKGGFVQPKRKYRIGTMK